MSDEKQNIVPKDNELIGQLEKQVVQLKQESKDNFDLFLRAKAEVENIKKRTYKEINNISKYANKELIINILPLLDSLEACLKNTNIDNDRNGIILFYKLLINMLEKHCVKKIDVKKYSDFDPSKHEVVSKVDDLIEDNKINVVLQSGYTLNDQVLRYSKVTIFKKKESNI